jgi:alanine racemase
MYTPLNKVLIDKAKLLDNFRVLKSLNPNTELFPVLKSNAYGHGLKQIGEIIKDLNLKYVCVDSLFEAYELTKVGYDNNILITGYVDPENLKVKSLPFSYVIWSLDQAINIKKIQKNAKFHLFVDTGMNREGIRIDELEELLINLKSNDIKLEGLMSHFASADDLDSPQSSSQIEKFKETKLLLEKYEFNPIHTHISASAGMLRNLGNEFNAARVGLAFYGQEPIADQTLVPFLSLTSTLIQIKKVKKGEQIGYNATFTADRDMIVGILPIGYNDGVERKLSNLGMVKYGETFCPIVGRVSMNITTIDISRIINPKVGDQVYIYTDHKSDINSIENVAKASNMIPYEILVHINPSTRREII